MLKRLDPSDAGAIAIGPSRERPWFSFEAVASLLPLIDVLIILAASVVGAISYFWLSNESSYPFAAPPDLTSWLAVGMLAGSIYALWMHSGGHYDVRLCLQARLEIGQILRAWAFSALMLALMAFLLKVGSSFSRGSFLAFLVAAPIGLVACRALTKPMLRRWIENGTVGRRNIVLIGDRDELDSLDPEQFLNFFGVVDARRFTLNHYGDPSTDDAPVLQSAIDFARANDSDEILLALPWRDAKAVEAIRNELRMLPIPVRLLPDRSLRNITSYPSLASSLHVTFLVELQAAPLTYFDRAVKRLMDIGLGIDRLHACPPDRDFGSDRDQARLDRAQSFSVSAAMGSMASSLSFINSAR